MNAKWNRYEVGMGGNWELGRGGSNIMGRLSGKLQLDSDSLADTSLTLLQSDSLTV